MPEQAKETTSVEEGKDPSQDLVDVTPKPAPTVSAEDQLAAKIREDFEKLYGSRIQSTEDRLHGAQRINERLQKELDSLKQQVARLPQTAAVVSPDPWATLENGSQWKAEVEKLAEQKAQEKLTAWQAEQQAQSQLKAQLETLESSKRKVVTKYPDLDPDTGTSDTPVSRAYLSILNDHPEWLTNPYGPILAMYAMEEALTTPEGKPTVPATPRTYAASPTASRPDTGAGGNRVVLTKEQKEFCDYHGLKYEDYAKNLQNLESGGGLEA